MCVVVCWKGECGGGGGARWGGWEGKGRGFVFDACAVREVLIFLFSIADFSVRGNPLVVADFGIRGNMVIVADLGVRAEIIIRNDVVAYVHLPAVMGFPLFGPPERLVRE